MELVIKDDESKKMLFGKPTEKTGYEKFLGKNVFIRTVTYHYTGHVEEVTPHTMTISTAAWVADSGRLNDFLSSPDEVVEVEPFPNPVTLGLPTFIDITEIPKLLTEVK